MIDEVLFDADDRMGKAVEALRQGLSSIRTGRASPALVEYIRVDYHGIPTPVNQLATISVPEARLIIIQPWDRGVLPAIERAILKSDLGLNPSNDGNVVRLFIPLLTEERRGELVRMVRKRTEEGRVAVRNIRREAVEELRRLLRNKEISQDEQWRAQEQLQRLTDSVIERVNDVGRDKEDEVLEI